MMDRHFLFLTSSARQGGNSETLARRAALTVPQPQRWIDLTETALPAFSDNRPKAPHRPAGQLAVIAQAMKGATDLVFVAPIYWYALPAPAKLLLDHWSTWLDIPGFGFVDWMKPKTIWLITARADPDPTVPIETESMLRKTTLWLGATWGGALHGIGDEKGDVNSDAVAMDKADRFFT